MMISLYTQYKYRRYTTGTLACVRVVGLVVFYD